MAFRGGVFGGVIRFWWWISHAQQVYHYKRKYQRNDLSHSTMGGHREKKDICTQESPHQTTNSSVGALLLDFSDSRATRNTGCCLSHPVYSILLN